MGPWLWTSATPKPRPGCEGWWHPCGAWGLPRRTSASASCASSTRWGAHRSAARGLQFAAHQVGLLALSDCVTECKQVRGACRPVLGGKACRGSGRDSTSHQSCMWIERGWDASGWVLKAAGCCCEGRAASSRSQRRQGAHAACCAWVLSEPAVAWFRLMAASLAVHACVLSCKSAEVGKASDHGGPMLAAHIPTSPAKAMCSVVLSCGHMKSVTVVCHSLLCRYGAWPSPTHSLSMVSSNIIGGIGGRGLLTSVPDPYGNSLV